MTTIKQLNHFLILAKELHFAKAAQILGISQATLSNEIKKLEKNLGFQLFDRSNKWEITLTASGENYLQHVKNIPDMLNNARQDAMEIARGESGILSIAISNFTYDFFNLGQICQEMHNRYPGIKIKVYDILRSPFVAEYIKKGKADIGFFVVSDPQRQAAGFKYMKLLDSQMVLGIPAKHPLAKKAVVTMDDLKNAPFILPPPEETPMLRKKLDEIFITHCHQLPVTVMEIIGFSGIRQFIANGLGVGLLPQQLTINDDIVTRQLPFPMSRIMIAACDEANNSPTVRNFMNLLSEKQKKQL